MEIIQDQADTTVDQSGMLTTIPFDEFMSLSEQTEDSNVLDDVHKFKWDDFVACANNYSLMTRYLDKADCRELGVGSARIVYSLKKAEAGGYVDGPCVLKVAIHNTKGPAQNKAEAVMLGRYQNKMECFPKLYVCDKRNWYYLLTEIGTPLNTAPESFVNKQLGHLRKYFRSYLKINEFPGDAELFEEDDFDIENMDQFVYVFSSIMNFLSGNKKSDVELLWFYDLIDDMTVDEDPLVRCIGQVLKYAQYHGSRDVDLSDFAQTGNWGFVKRDGQFMLIPIDWGASPEVVKKYYTKESLRKVITFSQLKRLLR